MPVMMRNLPLRLKNLAVLVFSLIILYLAGFYFGGYLMTLFYFALTLPLLSLILCLITLAGMRYHQDFDTEHPVKGQEIHYRLTLSNESIVPIAHMHCSFKAIHQHMDLTMPGFSTYLKAKGEKTESYTFRCSYRGIYTVGLERIEISDPLGFITTSPSVLYRTFYVYPRILRIPQLPLEIRNWEGGGTGSSHGGDPDLSLYTQLRQYSEGQSIRHIHWKKFALTGKPFLTEYETTAEPEIRVYLDTRPCQGRGNQVLEIEDTSVEITVALVKYFLDRGIFLTVLAPGRDVFRFAGAAAADFDRFYRATINIMFQTTISPSQLFRSEGSSASHGNRTTLFITHLMDPELLGLIEDSLITETPFVLIYNGVGQERKGRVSPAFHRLREKGAKILVVENPESIVADLGAQ